MILNWILTAFMKTDIMTSKWPNCLITCLHLIFWSWKRSLRVIFVEGICWLCL